MAVEIKRVAGIEAVEQLTRYLERIRLDPAVRVVPRGARGAGDQAAGPRAGGVARDRLRRGRPRGAAGRARAGTEIVRCMNEQPAVLTERRERVLVITLNRPDQRNAVNAAVARGIAAALDELDADHELSLGVLTGAGKGFCAGMDLKAFVAGEWPYVGRPRVRRHHPAGGRQAADRRGRGVRGRRRARDRAVLRSDRRLPRRQARHPRGQALAGRGRRRAAAPAARAAAQRRDGAGADRRPDHRRARLRARARQPAGGTGRGACRPRSSWPARSPPNGPLALAASKRILAEVGRLAGLRVLGIARARSSAR